MKVAQAGLTTTHNATRVKTTTRNWRVSGYRGGLLVVEFARGAVDLLNLCVEGGSLGLLRRDDVDRIVFDAYDGEPEYYDPDSYSPAFEIEEAALAENLRQLAPGTRLLDAFCGQGREARLLAAQGFEVTGIDRLPVMIERARKYGKAAGFDAEFTVAEFERYEAAAPYDVVYTSAWMYSTLQGRECRMNFLRHCRALCAEDGVIVISYKVRSTTRHWPDRLRHIIARTIALLTCGNRGVELGDRLYYGLFWHHFAEFTLDQEIAEAGLRSLSTHNVNDGKLVFRVLGAAAND